MSPSARTTACNSAGSTPKDVATLRTSTSIFIAFLAFPLVDRPVPLRGREKEKDSRTRNGPELRLVDQAALSGTGGTAGVCVAVAGVVVPGASGVAGVVTSSTILGPTRRAA